MLDRLLSTQDSMITLETANKLGSKHGNVLKEYFYSNLSYTYEWEKNWEANDGAIGGCWLDFTVSGDISEICDVLIASGSPMPPWTSESIINQGNWIIPIWQNNERAIKQDFSGHFSGGFPIMPDELGVSGEVLLFALNAEYNAVGHIIVPVQLPDSYLLNDVIQYDAFWEAIWGKWRYINNSFVYELTFDKDGNTKYSAGEVNSEWGGVFIGTSTVQNNEITVHLTEIDIRYEDEKDTPFEPSHLNTTLALEPRDGQLIVELVSGDKLYFAQEVGKPIIYNRYIDY
jgi:hypothetical protein